jgi:predicted AAA+ superfamily ATPase
LLSVTPDWVIPYYYRTAGGAEIDLILEFSGNEKWAIEIKRSSAPSVSKGFPTACADLNPERRYVVYYGADQFPLTGGITAIPLPQLMQELLAYTQ